MNVIARVQIHQYNDPEILEFFIRHRVEFRLVGDHLFIIRSRKRDVAAGFLETGSLPHLVAKLRSSEATTRVAHNGQFRDRRTHAASGAGWCKRRTGPRPRGRNSVPVWPSRIPDDHAASARDACR